MLRAVGPLANEDVQLEVLHGRIEDLLDRPVEAVDLIDEEDVTLLQVGEEGGQIAGPHQDRARGDAQADAHLRGHDAGQRGLAQTGGAGEQQVVGRLIPLQGGFDDDLQMLGELPLADELGQCPGPQAGVLGLLGRCRLGIDRSDLVAGADPGTGKVGSLAGQYLSSRLGGHRLRANSRSAERTISSTGPSSSTASSAARISSGP